MSILTNHYANFQQHAKKVLSLRQFLPEQIKRQSSPSLNEKRDALILELKKAGTPFAVICDKVNQSFPDEMIDEKAAGQALKRYCTRLQIPYPYGKRGRKADK